jgi:hypothetical protein
VETQRPQPRQYIELLYLLLLDLLLPSFFLTQYLVRYF